MDTGAVAGCFLIGFAVAILGRYALDQYVENYKRKHHQWPYE